MLRRHSLQYYLDELKGKNLNIEELFSAVGKRFEPEERSRALIRNWYVLSHPIAVNENSVKKPKSDGLNILVSLLTDIQTSLPVEYQPEIFFQNK